MLISICYLILSNFKLFNFYKNFYYYFFYYKSILLLVNELKLFEY